MQGNQQLCMSIKSSVYVSMFNLGVDEGCEGYVVASESCSFGAIGARYHREVLPGENNTPIDVM